MELNRRVTYDQNKIYRKMVATKIRYIVEWSYEENLPKTDLPAPLQATPNGFSHGP